MQEISEFNAVLHHLKKEKETNLNDNLDNDEIQGYCNSYTNP
jgi:hypothetical protein